MQLDFNNVSEASDAIYTEPGTIDSFLIQDVTFGESSNGKGYIECNFKQDNGSSFKHRFYTSSGALPRIQSLWKTVNGATLSGQVGEEQIVAGLKGKKLALKVTARIAEDTGRAYADLPFGGFCKTVDKMSELSFTSAEQEAIHAGRASMTASIASSADKEVPAPANDDF